MADLYAEDLNYWRTSQAAPDTWMDKAKAEIKAAGGVVRADAYVNEAGARAAYLLEFDLAGERYRVVWPVLQSRAGNVRAARVQAATMLYHDLKARALTAKVLGAGGVSDLPGVARRARRCGGQHTGSGAAVSPSAIWRGEGGLNGCA